MFTPGALSELLAPNFEKYQSIIEDSFFISPNHPQIIIKLLKRVKKLLLHSYYEYEFLDVALLQITIALEKRLKIEYKLLNPTDSKRRMLDFLLKWARKKNLFELDNLLYLQVLKDIRNDEVHDETDRLLGITSLEKIYTINKLINDVEGDPVLRQKRMLTKRYFNMYSNQLLTKG
jgi:hypothetical protein